jgi:ubiquinone/menaquinone biosynthesis C-methylase UbiE
MIREIISSFKSLLENIALRILGKNYIVFDHTGKCVNPDNRSSADALELVDKRKYLLLEKGRYKIVHKEGHILAEDEPMGMKVIDNSSEAYDRFWGDSAISEKYVESSMTFYQEVLDKCRSYLRGTILDSGCGTAGFFGLISKNNIRAELYGMDFSLSSIRRSRERVPGGGFIVSDIRNIGYSDHSFDVVICTETLEHLELPDTALLEIKRVCKDGGTIIITVPNGDRDSYVGHLNFWNKDSFMKFIGFTGLKDFQYLEDGGSMLFVIRN